MKDADKHIIVSKGGVTMKLYLYNRLDLLLKKRYRIENNKSKSCEAVQKVYNELLTEIDIEIREVRTKLNGGV